MKTLQEIRRGGGLMLLLSCGLQSLDSDYMLRCQVKCTHNPDQGPEQSRGGFLMTVSG